MGWLKRGLDKFMEIKSPVLLVIRAINYPPPKFNGSIITMTRTILTIAGD